MSRLEEIQKRREAEREKKKTTLGNLQRPQTGAQTQAPETPQLGGQTLQTLQKDLMTAQEEGFSLGDFLETFGEHAVSSATFGLSEKAGLETEAWEDKTGWEKVAAGAGEFAGMLLPFKGMSTIIGKGIGAATKLGTKQTVAASAAAAAKKAMQRGVSKEGVENITSALGKSAIDDVGNLAPRLSLGGEAAEQVIETVGVGARGRIAKMLSDNGISLSQKGVDEIVTTFQQGLREGKHINNLEQWMGHLIGVDKLGPGMGKNIAKYLSMASAETAVLGLYNTLSGQSRELVLGENFGKEELKDSWKHAAWLGGTFPAIRGAFNWGGQVTLRQGLNGLMKGYSGVNYGKVAEQAGGREMLHTFIKSMRGGTTKNFMAGRTWKVGDDAINIFDDIAVDKLSANQSVELLNQMRAWVTGPGFRQFGKEWGKDFAKAIPAMTLGALANNVHFLKNPITGKWKDPSELSDEFSPQEMIYHVAMGAFFTRNRGAWNHGSEPAPALKDWYAMSDAMGLKTDGFAARIAQVSAKDFQAGIGAGLHNNPATGRIYDIVERTRATIEANKKEGQRKIEIDPFAEGDLELARQIHYLMDVAAQKDPYNYDPLELRYLTKQQRTELLTQLKEVKLTDTVEGKPKYLGDFSSTQVEDFITMQLGEGAAYKYKQYLSKLSESGLIDISIDPATGKIIAPEINLSQLENSPNLLLTGIDSMLKRFESWGMVERDASKQFDASRFIGVEGANNRGKLDVLTTEFKDLLVREQYGKGVELADFDFFNNNILNSIQGGIVRKNLMTLFDINMSNTSQLTNEQRTVLNVLTKGLTSTESNLLIKDLSKQLKIKRDGEEIQTGSLTDKEAIVLEKFYALSDIFLSGRGDKSSEGSRSMEMTDINRIVDIFERTGLVNENILHSEFHDTFMDYKIRRLANQSVSPAKFGIISELMENGEWAVNRDTHEIQILSAEGKRLQLIKEGGFSDAEASAASKKWQQIIDVIGHGNGKIQYRDEITLPREVIGGIDSPKMIEKIWSTLPEQMSRLIEQPLKKVVEQLNIVDSEGNLSFEKNVVHGVVEDLNNALKNYSDSQGASGIEAITTKLEQLRSKVSKLKETGQAESTDMKMFIELTKAVQKVAEGRITYEQLAEEFITGPDGRQIQPGQAFRYLIAQDSYAQQSLQSYVNQMIHHGSKGKNRMDHYTMYQSLRKELARELAMDHTKEISLDKLIDQYNTTRSFKDFQKVIDAAQKSLAQNQFVNRPMEYDRQLQDSFSKFLAYHSYTNPVIQFGALAETYNIKGKFGEPVDQVILDEVNFSLANRDHARLNQLRDKIIAENITESVGPLVDPANIQKLSELTNSFIKNDFVKIVDHLSGSELVPIAKLSGGMIEYDITNPSIKGPRSEFRKMVASKGIQKLFEFETSAVDGGQSKHIALTDINNRLAGSDPIVARVTPRKETMESIKQSEKIDITDIIQDFTNHPNPSNSVVIMVSEGNPFMFEKSAHNVDMLNRWFGEWRTGKEAIWRDKINKMNAQEAVAENIKLNNWLESMAALDAPGVNNQNIILKMRSLYWDNAFPGVYESRFSNDIMGDKLRRRAFDDNFYKRLKLYEGGNMHPFSTQLLDYIVNNARIGEGPGDPAYNMRLYNASNKILKEGVRVAAIGDEISGDPTWTVSKSREKQLTERIAKEKDALTKADLQEQLNELRELKDGDVNFMESLDASAFNAATFIDANMAMILAAKNGQAFDPTKANGWKPIGYHKDPATGNLMAMKTWFVYSPRKAQMLQDKGINILTTQSAAKIFMGKDNSGKNLEFLQFKNRDTWEADFKGMDFAAGQNTVNLPIDAFSIGSSNHKDRGVSMMHSLHNFANQRSALDLMEYQKLDYMLSQISEYSDGLLNRAKVEIARGLSQFKNETEGINVMSETQGLAEGLLNVGMRTDNPIIKDVINRAFMTQAMNMLRRPKNERGGTSSYLIIDDLSFSFHGQNRTSLSDPIFRRMESKWDDPVAGVEKDARIQNIRIQTQLGGVAQSADWAMKEVNNINQVRLVARINGVDHLIGFESKKKGYSTEIVNPYDVITGQQKVNNPRLVGEKTTREFKAPKKELDFIHKEIDRLINNGAISTNKHIFDLLQTGEINGERIFSDKIMKTIKELNIGQTVNTVAIPRKSLDVVTNRVEHILDAGYGNHVITNDYEVAVTHQRDFDMDHIYSYSNMPMSYMKQAYQTAGMVIDYAKYNRVPVDVDPFLQGETTNGAGFGSSTGDGLGEYIARRQSQKMAIGTFVGMNQPLTSLANLGLKVKIAQGEIGMDYIPSIENMNSLAGFIERNGNVIQTNVDPFGGTAKLFKELNSIEKFVLFGDMSDLAKETHRPEHYKGQGANDYNPVFNIGTSLSPDGKLVVQDILSAVINKTRRAQSLFNDVYENGVQRSITPWDVKRTHRDLTNLFGENGNKYIFMSLFNKYTKYDKSNHKLQELVKIFFGGADQAKHRYGTHAKKIIEGITADIRAGKFWTKEVTLDRIIQFNQAGVSEMMNQFPAGKILEHFNSKGTFTEKNTQGNRNEPVKSDILNHTRNLIDSVTMLRMVGHGENMIYDAVTKGDMYYGLDAIVGKDIKAHENRGVAYTYLNNRFRETVNNLEYTKSVSKTKSSTKIEQLQQELASITVAMNAVEKASMYHLGAGIESIGQRNRPISVSKRRNWKNRGNRDVVLYKVRKGTAIDEATIKGMEYGETGGLQFHANVSKGKNAPLQPGYTYIVLENPLIAKYMTSSQVKDGYAWHLATRDIHWENYIDPARHPEFVQNLTETIDMISYDYRARLKKAKDESVFAKEIHQMGAIEEQNHLSRFFSKWASEERSGMPLDLSMPDQRITNLDPTLVSNIALQLMAPEGVPRIYVQGEGASKLPHFQVNTRLQKAVLKWVNDNGYMPEIGERMQVHSNYYAHLQEGLSPKDLEMIARSEMLYSPSWESDFIRYGERAGFVSNLLSDKFNLVGGAMADLLKSQGVVKTRGGSYVDIYSAEGLDMSTKTQKYEAYKPGEAKNLKSVYWCP